MQQIVLSTHLLGQQQDKGEKIKKRKAEWDKKVTVVFSFTIAMLWDYFGMGSQGTPGRV